MKRGLGILALIAVLSYGSYHTVLHYIPDYVYHKFKTKASKTRGSERNVITPILAPDENSKMVVKPNPDFAYGSGFYDIRKGPVRIKGEMPDSIYWSVALYQPNTVNYYVKNDMQYGEPRFDIVIGKEDPQIAGSEFINAPTEEGFLLLRLLVTDKSQKNLDRTEALLNGITMEVIPHVRTL